MVGTLTSCRRNSNKFVGDFFMLLGVNDEML